jgi:hypothetical protein
VGGGVGWGVGGGGGGRRRARGEVAEGYAPYLGVGYCREGGLLGEKGFEGLPRGLWGDALACRGHPYMFSSLLFKDNFFIVFTQTPQLTKT